MESGPDFARRHRNIRLQRTDKLMVATDRPDYQEIKDLRKALRDYPTHKDWPSLEKMPDPYKYFQQELLCQHHHQYQQYRQ